jgi:hypothetical protein
MRKAKEEVDGKGKGKEKTGFNGKFLKPTPPSEIRVKPTGQTSTEKYKEEAVGNDAQKAWNKVSNTSSSRRAIPFGSTPRLN